MGEFDKIVSFLDGINDEKFSGWKDKEYTIADNSKLGFRLDHQGVNNDTDTKQHRIFIQPIKGGKSKMSKKSSGLVIAQVHCDDPEDAEKVRDGLKQSFKNKAQLVVV